jgi:hypothetical protein
VYRVLVSTHPVTSSEQLVLDPQPNLDDLWDPKPVEGQSIQEFLKHISRNKEALKVAVSLLHTKLLYC